MEGLALFLLGLRAGEEAPTVVRTILENRPQNAPLTVCLAVREGLVGPLKVGEMFTHGNKDEL